MFSIFAFIHVIPCYSPNKKSHVIIWPEDGRIHLPFKFWVWTYRPNRILMECCAWICHNLNETKLTFPNLFPIDSPNGRLTGLTNGKSWSSRGKPPFLILTIQSILRPNHLSTRVAFHWKKACASELILNCRTGKPPESAKPQVTTDPPAKMAANAAYVDTTYCTFLSRSRTAELSPPCPRSQQIHRLRKRSKRRLCGLNFPHICLRWSWTAELSPSR